MADEHTSEVSNTEHGGTCTDLSKFEALALNDGTPHTLESADMLPVHLDAVDNGTPDSTIQHPSTPEQKEPSEIPRKYWPPKFKGTAIIARRKAEREFAEREFVERQAQSLQARGQCTHASKIEISCNAKKWMSGEVMVAFRRYIESEDDLKDIEYEFEELLYQCFNVEHYFKIFHHFNFNVKIKKHGSTDWTVMTYFAEVMSVLETKHYVCYPLDREENGQCHACKKQGMHELRHPSADIFDCGSEATTFPYNEDNDSDSDESHPVVGGSESDDDMS